LFGVGDVLAVHPDDRVTLLVQCTSSAHVGDRLRRVRARPETGLLLKAGLAVEVWGSGRRGGRWVLKRVQVAPGDLEPVVLQAPKPRRRRKGERQGTLFTP
jgi:hypothetical protein